MKKQTKTNSDPHGKIQLGKDKSRIHLRLCG